MSDKITTATTDTARQHVQTVRLQGSLEDGDGLADLPKKIRKTGVVPQLRNNPSVVTVSGLSLRTSSFQENNSRRNSKVWPDDQKPENLKKLEKPEKLEKTDNPEKPQNRRKS